MSINRANYVKNCGCVICNFIKKEALAQVFPSEFCGISKNIFFTIKLQDFIECNIL